MKFLVLLAVVVAVAAVGVQSAVAPKVSNAVWTDFKVKFKKNYATAAEEANRRNIFAQNVAAIELHNQQYAQGRQTYSMAVNQFSDLLPTEFGTKTAFKGFGLSSTRTG